MYRTSKKKKKTHPDIYLFSVLTLFAQDWMKIERVTYMVAGYSRKESFPSNKFAPKDLKRKSHSVFSLA